MTQTHSPTHRTVRGRLDRIGVMVSGLCAVHCVATALLVGVLGLGGGFLLSPSIHRIGLGLAVTIAGIGLGLGARRHGRRLPLLVGAVGLALMSVAMVLGHSYGELVEGSFTVVGVALVAFAHIRNLHAHT